MLVIAANRHENGLTNLRAHKMLQCEEAKSIRMTVIVLHTECRYAYIFFFRFLLTYTLMTVRDSNESKSVIRINMLS